MLPEQTRFLPIPERSLWDRVCSDLCECAAFLSLGLEAELRSAVRETERSLRLHPLSRGGLCSDAARLPRFHSGNDKPRLCVCPGRPWGK